MTHYNTFVVLFSFFLLILVLRFHQVLLKILHDDIDVRGIALKWFHSLLTGRSERVQVGTSRSEPLNRYI